MDQHSDRHGCSRPDWAQATRAPFSLLADTCANAHRHARPAAAPRLPAPTWRGWAPLAAAFLAFFVHRH